MSAEGNLYDPAIFAEAPQVGEEGSMYWRGRDGKGGFRMDEALRRYLDIIYKYVLEQAPPARKPLYMPGEAAARDPPTPEASDEPPRKRAKTGAEPVDTTTAAETDAAKAPEPTTEVAQQANGKGEGKSKNANKKQKREKVSNPNLIAMQPHCFHLLRALVSQHHPVRDALARSRPGDMEAYEGVLGMVEEVVEKGIREYEATGGASYHDALEAEGDKGGNVLSAVGYEGLETEGEVVGVEYETSVKAVRECRRPWWVCQPYVRPLPMEAMAKGSLTLSKKELAKLKDEEREAAMSMGARKNDGKQNGGVKGEGEGQGEKKDEGEKKE
jgi:tRNA-dihydrouridine synthase 1